MLIQILVRAGKLIHIGVGIFRNERGVSSKDSKFHSYNRFIRIAINSHKCVPLYLCVRVCVCVTHSVKLNIVQKRIKELTHMICVYAKCKKVVSFTAKGATHPCPL